MRRRLSWAVDAGGALAAGFLMAGLLVLFAPPPTLAQTGTGAPVLPEGYVGAETCKGCHEPAFEKFSHTKMGRLFLRQPRNSTEGLACESCHGPGKAHVDAGGGKGKGGLVTFAKNDPTPVDKRNATCLGCHTKGARIFWQGSAHESRDVACTNCHTIMEEVSPKNQLAKETVIETCGTCHLQKRAATMRSSHMPLREGKMTCTSCHNPHGTVTPALLKEASLNQTCFTCHTEKRGPFLWSHAPVVESCANCHDPHGSNHESMLKISKPRLCQQCHVETRHPTNPFGRDTGSLKFVLGRACTDCHANIHGSNHPAGFAFTR
jgi:DmsE family decaheme c-type cytochrome